MATVITEVDNFSKVVVVIKGINHSVIIIGEGRNYFSWFVIKD